MVTAHSPRRVELFVRSLSPAPTRSPVDEHLLRLRRLAADGTVTDLSVDVWGREVGLSTTAARTDAGSYVLDRVAEFKSWAQRRDVSLDPFFETRAVGAGLTGESHTALVLPVCCLAEYESGDLVHVAPYATETAVHAVSDRIRALERGTDGSRGGNARNAARGGDRQHLRVSSSVESVAETVATADDQFPDRADDAPPAPEQ